MMILDYILLAAVAALIVWAVVSIRRQSKKGGCRGCSGCCAECSGCNSSPSQDSGIGQIVIKRKQ